MYLGRHILGDLIPVPVWSRTIPAQTPTEPVEAPYVRVHDDSGFLESFRLPAMDLAQETGLFQHLVSLNYTYATGYFNIIVTTKLRTGPIGTASNASPIVITDTAHGLATGDAINVSNVQGNTAANGNWVVTYVAGNKFSLDGSVGNSAYTAGGVWNSILHEHHHFQIVAGGDADGRGIELHFFDAAPRPFVLMQTDAGKILKLRNPRVS